MLVAGTETEEWRTTSAQIAWVLWVTERRMQGAANPKADKAAWDAAAKDYRALVRLVLRALEGEESIKLRKSAPHSALPSNSPKWREKTARIAWRLWLQQWRQKYMPDQKAEAEHWEVVSKDYRAYVRKALMNLEADGIRVIAA